MTESVEQGLASLRDLGGVEEMWSLAAGRQAPPSELLCNGHIHLPPNFSAFESVEQALDLAAAQGVNVVGASNYYDYRVYGPFVAQARRRGIFPLFGLEIISLVDELARQGVKVNDPGNPGRMYICGKGITRFAQPTPKARELLDFIRRSDKARMAAMIDKLAGIFRDRGLDTGLTEDRIIDRVVERHGCPRDAVYLQERHVAQVFQEALFAGAGPGERGRALARILGAEPKKSDDTVAVQGEIRSHLMKAGKPAFVEERFLDFPRARTLILALGGIPCYPTLADGANPVCPYETPPEKLVAAVRDMGVHCAELIPIRNKPDVLERYVLAFRGAGIVVTAGTEHNTLDMLPIEPQCVGGADIAQPIKDIFREGACVIAAHQFLGLHGQEGFVDARGEPSRRHADAQERIAAFAALGAAVIARYRKLNPAGRPGTARSHE